MIGEGAPLPSPLCRQYLTFPFGEQRPNRRYKHERRADDRDCDLTPVHTRPPAASAMLLNCFHSSALNIDDPLLTFTTTSSSSRSSS